MAKKKKHAKAAARTPVRAAAAPPRKLLHELALTERLMAGQKWREALTHLQQLDRQYPNQPAVVGQLVNVAYGLRDMKYYWLYVKKLVELAPNDPDTHLMLASAQLANQWPALSLQTFRQFLQRYPDHEQAPAAQEEVDKLDQALQAFLTDLGISGDEGLALALAHDSLRSHMLAGESVAARRVAEQVLQTHPDFTPVLNNLSLMACNAGDFAEAIALARRSLAVDPQNVQAAGNLTRYLYLSEQTTAAQEQAAYLKSLPATNTENWLKKAEALTIIADDQGVLDLLTATDSAEQADLPALFWHFVAVATLRLGDEATARTHWQRSLRLDPNLTLAEENLADLQKPRHERHAPWPFDLNTWIAQEEMAAFTQHMLPAAKRNSSAKVERAAQQYVRERPHMPWRLRILLERGDPGGRDFALKLIQVAETPELLELARDFALSPNGPDEMRVRAANIAQRGGLLPSGMTRLWIRGEWSEMLLLAFEISGEARRDNPHSPQVTRLLRQGSEALHAGQYREAERIFTQALALEPGRPDLQNNLATSYQAQGKMDQAIALVRQLHHEHPDYYFGRIAMANVYIEQGKFDEAEAMLQPLLTQQRLHFSEFTALCQTHLNLCTARDQLDAARSWLAIWQQVIPNHPQQAYWERKLNPQPSANLAPLRRLLRR